MFWFVLCSPDYSAPCWPHCKSNDDSTVFIAISYEPNEEGMLQNTPSTVWENCLTWRCTETREVWSPISFLCGPPSLWGWKCGQGKRSVPVHAGMPLAGWQPLTHLVFVLQVLERGCNHPQQGRVENAALCMGECAHVYMCGPGSKGRAGTSLQNNIKKPKHFPLRNRITAHGILTQPEKRAAAPPFH